MNMPTKVILDVDTGSDDAVALIAAALSPEIDLAAICTVWGNQPIENTTDNTLRLVQALGLDVPVYKGCDTAMTKYLTNDFVPNKVRPAVMHDGKPFLMHAEHLDLPEASICYEDMPAAVFYIDYLRKAEEKVTLVPVGPLTNLGLALRIAPDIVEKVDQIVIMGGGSKITNCNPWSESNIWHDPEAAQIVIDCGAKVVFVPLDATHAAPITLDDCKRFRKMNTFASHFAADQCEQRIIVHNSDQPLEIPDSAAVHDPLCIAYLIDPTVLTDVRHCHVEIGLSGFGEGQTIVDPRAYTLEKNAYFAFDADRAKFVDILCACFEKGKKV
jgi:inosine-uridine nucleoside N-ribohydrolase